jgi:FkbM family methyltransferase
MLPKVDLIRTDEHDWLLTNGKDHISEFIRHNGFWGRLETAFSKALLHNRSNIIVIDAGANLGGFTIPVANLINRLGGLIYSFEPQRIVFQQLCANAFLNRLDNVIAFNIGLADYEGKLEVPELDVNKSSNLGAFSIDPNIRASMIKDASDNGRTFPNVELQGSPTQFVDIKSVDSLQISGDLALLKIDVEGLELEVLRGAIETIKASKHPPIIFELWEGKDWYAEKAKTTLEFLTNQGYTFTKSGREVIAQHPAHPHTCIFEQTPEGMQISRLVGQ